MPVSPHTTTRITLLALGLLAATPQGARSARNSTLPPTKTAALTAWLRAGTYRSWVAEPAVRPSFTAHGRNERTWLNPILAEDLRAGRTPFRKGAAMVKELYFDGREQVVGFAVMRKVRKRSGNAGQGWFFFETFDGSTPITRPGRGAQPCVGCHQAGRDHYLLGFEP